MAKRVGVGTYDITSPVTVVSSAGVVGKKEGAGPLGKCFDKVFADTSLGAKTWEQAESSLQKAALETALAKGGFTPADIQAVLAGDLLNQCIAATFGLASLHIPFFGVYGACSTMTETLILASLLLDGGGMDRCAAVTSSHFCSAERQFRFPLEYGGVRTPTSQWTATGAGAVILQAGGTGTRVACVTPGTVCDLGITDQNNMGAAMAPAAAQVISRYFADKKAHPSDFDAIVTGDLGLVGSRLLLQLLQKDGLDISAVHQDCGLLLYDRSTQQVAAGGSGCGCSASVLACHFLPKLASGEYRRMLMISTGALLSPTSVLQKQTIPCIAHLVELEEGGV